MWQTYLLLHDYKDLCGIDILKIPGIRHNNSGIYFESITTKVKDEKHSWERGYEVLENQSDKHFKKIIDTFFYRDQIDIGITRDIRKLELEYTLVPKGTSQQDELNIEDPYYTLFSSSLVSISDYFNDRLRYKEYHEFAKYIKLFAQRKNKDPNHIFFNYE